MSNSCAINAAFVISKAKKLASFLRSKIKVTFSVTNKTRFKVRLFMTSCDVEKTSYLSFSLTSLLIF